MIHQSTESQQTQAFTNDYESVLPDHYRLIEMVGRGGMAEVFLAEDKRLSRKVAIKFLNSEFRRDPDRMRRFRQEAKSASALNHQNILTIHDIGESSGVQYLVSEFVEGETLGARISRGRLPISEAVDITLQVASALVASHAAGIVHRDIKPDNIMIRNDGLVKVLDFGLAKASGFTTADGVDFDAMTLDSGSTSPGLIVGTPQYMSPEQARGKELDGRTDIFSLGILLFEMVTRRSPFAGESFADTMAAILTKEPRRIEEFVDDPPARMVGLLEKCLKKDRNERFGSMADVEAELRMLKGEVVASTPETVEIDPARSDRTNIRPTHRHSIREVVSNTFREASPRAAVIILVTGVVLVGGWWFWDRASSPPLAQPLMRTVQITSWSSSASELVNSATFSPNGEMVAFSARKGDSTEIWVKPILGGDPIQVTRNGGYNQYPIWSPDGQNLAFLSDLGTAWGIWVIPFTGGDASRVLGGIDQTARPLRWGKQETIYFQSGSELFRTSRRGNVEQITNFGASGVAVNNIQISDDDESIAYSSLDGNIWKLIVRKLSDGREIVAATRPDQIDYIAWHPNGRSIFASFIVERALHIFEATMDGKPPIQRSNGDTNFAVHDVSEPGSVLYGTLAETSDIWRIETVDSRESIVANDLDLEFWADISLNGSIVFQSGSHVERPDWAAIKVAANPRARNVVTYGFLPSWSNDGSWIAFFRKGDSGYEIWKVRPNGTDLMRISGANVSVPVYFMAPYLTKSVSDISWSPDGTKVAFVAPADDGQRIRIADADGADDGVLLGSHDTGSARESGPLWTRDGTAIVSTSRIRGEDEVHRIVVTAVDSGERRTLYESREPIRVLGMASETGNLIFAKRDGSAETTPTPAITEIYSIPLAGGNEQKLRTLENAYFYNIHLAGNGSLLGYVTRKGERTAISTVPPQGGIERIHLVVNDPKILISRLKLSYDGSFIVFGKQTRTHVLSVLTH